MRESVKNKPGIYRVHRKACPRRSDKTARCTGTCPYQAMVNDKFAGKPIWSPMYPVQAAAVNWRQDKQRGIRLREISAATSPTLKEACDELLAGMRAKTVRSRNRRPFARSTIDRYEDALLVHVLPTLGEETRLDAISYTDVQDLVDTMAADGAKGKTMKATLSPLKVIWRRGRQRRQPWARNDPTRDLELPEDDSRESPYLEIGQMLMYIDALPVIERAAWALMFFAGLREGEMEALMWEDVDMTPPGRFVVKASHCKVSGERKLTTKNHKVRPTTMPALLLRVMREHRLASGNATGLVVNVPGDTRDKRHRRARKAWEAAGLEPINPHAARHSYATAAAQAGVQPDVLQRAIGHSAITTTYGYVHAYSDDPDKLAASLDALIAAQAPDDGLPGPDAAQLGGES